MGNEVAVLFERLLPETLNPLLGSVLAHRLIPNGPDGFLHQIVASGRFSGPQTADLLAFARSQKLDGAMVVVEQDVDRALIFKDGDVIAALSNMLFERLGRILYREGVISKEDCDAVVEAEEQHGIEAAIEMLPTEAARWGLERRIWDITTVLYFTRNAHFVIVEGTPNLGEMPTIPVPPMQLAMEGMRCYDEWRNAPSKQEMPAFKGRRSRRRRTAGSQGEQGPDGTERQARPGPRPLPANPPYRSTTHADGLPWVLFTTARTRQRKGRAFCVSSRSSSIIAAVLRMGLRTDWIHDPFAACSSISST